MPLQPDLFTLVFDERPRIPGETISGHVELNVRRAWNDDVGAVKLKIRGAVETMISRHSHAAGQGQHTITDRQVLIGEERILWQRQDTRFRQPTVDVVTIPFTFTLPRGLPPSSRTKSTFAYADVHYYVEVVAERSGRFRKNSRSRSIVKVGSAPDSSQQYDQYSHLMYTAMPRFGPSLERSVQPFLWQAASTISVQLALPDIPALPLDVAIPFCLKISIKTFSPHSEEACKEDESQTPLFPIAISDPKLLKLGLWRKSTVRAYLRGACREVDFSKHVPNVGGLGSPSAELRRDATVSYEPWTAAAGRRPGTFTRSRLACVESTMVFESLPSFESDLVKIDYFLRLSIPIKSKFRDLEFDFPVNLVKIDDTVLPAYENEPTVHMEPPPAYVPDQRPPIAL